MRLKSRSIWIVTAVVVAVLSPYGLRLRQSLALRNEIQKLSGQAAYHPAPEERKWAENRISKFLWGEDPPPSIFSDQLGGITFSRTRIPIDLLEELRGRPARKLQSIRCNMAKWDGGFKKVFPTLGPMPSLKLFDPGLGSKMDEETLSLIAKQAPHLSYLDLERSQIAPDHWKLIGEFQHGDSMSLRLTWAALADEGLAELAVYNANTRKLYLSETGITDASEEALGIYHHPERVDLARNDITEKGLRAMNLSRAISIDLGETRVDPRGWFDQVGPLPSLETLSLDTLPLEDKDIPQLIEVAPNLLELDARGTMLSEDGLRLLLREHPTLQKLSPSLKD